MKFSTLLSCLLLLGGLSCAGATSVSIFGTGLNPSSNLLPGGSTDTHWLVGSGSAVVMSTSNLFAGCCGLFPWMSDGPNSQWISTGDSVNVPTGDMDYKTTFDLSGFDLASVVINIGMAADGHVISVLLNGVDTSHSTGFNTWNALTTFGLSSGFVAGINTLEFHVDHEDGSYDAFRADLNGTGERGTAAPEPGSLILLGAGVVAVGLRRRKLA